MLSAVPRDGFDAYVSVGREYDGYGLRGTLTGFGYGETDFTGDLYGLRADLDIEYRRDLPEGMSIDFNVGLRGDNLSDDVDLLAGVALNWQFGGSSDAQVARNCHLVNNGSTRPDVSCGDAATPAVTQIASDLTGAAPAGLAQRVRVSRPRRHIGFGGSLTPVEVKGEAAAIFATFTYILEVGPQRFYPAPGSTEIAVFGPASNLSPSQTIPFAPIEQGGTYQTQIVLTEGPGNYTIHLPNAILLNGNAWGSFAVSCVGASSVGSQQYGGHYPGSFTAIEVQAGDNVTCTQRWEWLPH